MERLPPSPLQPIAEINFDALEESRPRQTKGSSDQVSSTRSVGTSLARRFNAGDQVILIPVA